MAHSIRLFAGAIGILAAMAGPADAQVVDGILLFDGTTNNLAIPSGTALVGDGGQNNTAYGDFALKSNSTGNGNTALGTGALSYNQSGSDNTALGFNALHFNLLSSQNTAVGSGALNNNLGGSQNVAVGYQALVSSNASNNTATGWQALFSDTTGAQNTAFGSSALYANQAGTGNVAVGYGSLYQNTASNNTAAGWQSLNANSTGTANTGFGTSALLSNTTGSNSTAFGYEALYNSTGSDNIALGFGAGGNLKTGSNDIYIGVVGGAAAENGHIRIGTHGTHIAAFLQGVYGAALTTDSPRAVYVNSVGQLGYLPSAQRYKTDVVPMGSATQRMEQLRPVTFRLKDDASRTVQYGLIAEEVAKVYPELVQRDSDGRIDGVRYEELAPMLLNEVQQHQRILAAQDERIAAQARDLQDLHRQLVEVRELKQQFTELKALIQPAKASQVKLPATEGHAENM
ncbi:MAG: tail fiber domain-containing protein [Steroidobacteraceae bacterium]